MPERSTAFFECVVRTWFKWLVRRSHRVPISWPTMKRLLERYPLPPPHIIERWGGA
jgi:hypothetical protein